MALPPVDGWLIDFRSAELVMLSASNIRISHCVQMCVDGKLFCCHCERDEFKTIQSLKDSFITSQDCVVAPDDDILKRSLSISKSHPHGKKRLTGNESSIFITAIAASKNFGVISDHRSVVFATAYDFCRKFGVPVYSVEEFFAEI
jgi:hypothetical protein